MAPRRSATLSFGLLAFSVLCLYVNFQLTNNKIELPPPVKEFLHDQNVLKNNTVGHLVSTPVGGSERLQALLMGVDPDDADQIDLPTDPLNETEGLPPLPPLDIPSEEGNEGPEVRPSTRNVTSRDAKLLIVSFLPIFRAYVTTSLLKELSIRNDFRLVMPLLHMQPKMGQYQRESLIKYITSAAEESPVAFLRDMYFFDITKMSFERPVWTAVVQDPVERLLSLFLKAKREQANIDELDEGINLSNMSLEQCIIAKNPLCWHSKGDQKAMQLSFFCGQHYFCELVGSSSGLQMAKYQVETQFSVVGILEELTLTFSVLQAYVPRFFGNATMIMLRTIDREELEMTDFLKSIPEKVRQYLRTLLRDEMDFYSFVKQRLHLQAVALGLIRDLL